MHARAVIRGAVALAAVGIVGVAAPLACSPSSSSPPAVDASGDAGPEACPSDLPAACPAPAPGYQATVAPLIQRRCWGCHADGGIEAVAHDLGSYDGVFRQRTSVLTQVYGCIMPPSDAAALTADERAALLGWLVCGAPAN